MISKTVNRFQLTADEELRLAAVKAAVDISGPGTPGGELAQSAEEIYKFLTTEPS
jgi:hypothetical protein